MTSEITFDSVLIVTCSGLERRESFAGSSIIVLEGPSLTGKSSFLHCMLYPLGIGRPAELTRAVRQNVDRVETDLTLGGSRFRLVRYLTKRPSRIEVYDAFGGERVEHLDLSGKTGRTPTEFLFEHTGLAKVLTGVTVGSGTATRAPVFADVLPFLYADQASVAHDIHRHQHHDPERRLLFELFMGLLDADVQQAKTDLERLRLKIKALKKELRGHEAFVTATAEPLSDIVARLEAARTAEQEATKLVAQLQRALTGANPPTRRPRGPLPVRPLVEPEFCPKCSADLRERDIDDRCCSLCLEPTKPGPTEASPPENSPKTPMRPQDEATLQALLDAKEALGNARALIQHYTALLRPHQRLDQLRSAITQFTAEADQAQIEYNELRGVATRRTERLEVLNEMFVEFVNLADPPHFEAAAELDPETYLPSIAGDTTKQMAPGLLETANVVFRAALLRYALLERHTYFPSTLILDSPQGQRGTAKDDRDYAQRLYDIFMKLLDSRRDLPGFTGASIALPKFQLIVVDNGIPSNVRGIKRIKLSYDNPLIPGVDYEPHEIEQAVEQPAQR